MTLRIRDRIVKTRKSHKCFGCCRTFEKGEEMALQTVVYEGEIYNIYSCYTCDVLMGNFSDIFYDDGEGAFLQGCVTEVYSNYNVNNPEDLLIKLKE